MTKTSKPGIDRNLAQQLEACLTTDAAGLFQFIQETDPTILLSLLKNPQLTEEHLFVLLQRRDLSEDLISAIHRLRKQSISHRLIVALVKNPSAPGHLVRNLLPQLRLFELVDICYLPGVTPDQKLAAERSILQRLPTTPLGNKITLARRGTANIVAELLKEGQPQLVEACLSSARIKEAAIFQFLRGPSANAETISLIARHQRWQHNPNLRLAILQNYKTPEIWYTLWLPKTHTHILKQLYSRHKHNPARKRLIEAEFSRRNIS